MTYDLLRDDHRRSTVNKGNNTHDADNLGLGHKDSPKCQIHYTLHRLALARGHGLVYRRIVEVFASFLGGLLRGDADP